MRIHALAPLALALLLPAAPLAGQVVPEGTEFEIELQEDLGVDDVEAGDRFIARTEHSVAAEGDPGAIPEDAIVRGVVTAVSPAREGRPSAVRIDIESILIDGREHPLAAAVVDSDVDIEDEVQEVDEDELGIGAGAGAVLGAVLGGGLEETILGGLLGAGAGTAISLGTGEAAALPEGADLVIRLTEPLHLH